MRIILGSEQLGGVDWGSYSIKDCERALMSAIEKGICKVDTANIYGLGLVEKRLGKILKKNISKVKIITKIGFKYKIVNKNKRANVKIDLSYKNLHENITNSLKNLKLDCVDTCLIHWPDNKTNYLESLEILKDFKKKGFIKNYGLSNYEKLVSRKNLKKFKHYQLKFNLLSNENYSFIKNLPNSTQTSLYGLLAHGLLSGKYFNKKKFFKNDRRHRLHDFSDNFLKKNRKKINFLKKYSAELDIDLPQFCLALSYNLLPNANLIVGFKNEKQIQKNLDAVKLKIPSYVIENYKYNFLN